MTDDELIEAWKRGEIESLEQGKQMDWVTDMDVLRIRNARLSA